jgi:hypothetical protein
MTAAMKAAILTRRPKWCIRSVPRGGEGMLVASCPPGIARTPEEALDWYRLHKPLAAKWHDLRAFPA